MICEVQLLKNESDSSTLSTDILATPEKHMQQPKKRPMMTLMSMNNVPKN